MKSIPKNSKLETRTCINSSVTDSALLSTEQMCSSTLLPAEVHCGQVDTVIATAMCLQVLMTSYRPKSFVGAVALDTVWTVVAISTGNYWHKASLFTSSCIGLDDTARELDL